MSSVDDTKVKVVFVGDEGINELMKELGEKFLQIEGLDKKASAVNLQKIGNNDKQNKCCD